MDNETVKNTEQETQNQQALEGAQPEQQGKQEPAADKGGQAVPKKKPPLPLIAAAAVVLVAVLVGIGIYNTPANRLSRQLDLGNRYLENEQYEEAIVAFERAISIDSRSMEAYAGALEAYIGMGDRAATEEFYDRTIAVLAELDEDFMEQNMDPVVEIYLAADKVYGTDPERAAQILEEGLAKTGDQGIKDHLIRDYQKVVEDKAASSDFEEVLTVYDRLLELDSTNTETINGLCVCLNEYIDQLMDSRQYDRIRELAEKYGDVAVNVDFGSILAKIQELEKIEAENRAFMQKVYDLMAAEDYMGMHEVDGSEEAEAFVERMEDDHYLYFPDDSVSLSGTGAGVYTFGEGGYYFYYGAIESGERKGTGTEFLNSGTGYIVFTGEWDKDAPNGAGVETFVGGIAQNTGSRYDSVLRGTLVNGLWDGAVEEILTDQSEGEKYDLSFSAENGVPTKDRTEEYLNEAPFGYHPGEGVYIYAFDYHRNVDHAWWSTMSEGHTVGITGFEE